MSAETRAEAALHRVNFQVMHASFLRTPDPAAQSTATALLQTYLDAETPTVPRRFAAMKTLLVLGRAIAPDSDLRPVLAAMIRKHGLNSDPPLPNGDALRLSLTNNHLLMQAAMLLAWPEIADGRETARALTARFTAQITESGIFPSEVCRGASCLWYSNLAVMLLTTIAFATRDDPAPMVTPDLLAQAISGLCHALRFPPEIRQLARRNLYAHQDHGHQLNAPDRGFLQDYHRSRHYLAWLPLAQALLPGRDLGLAISPDDHLPLCNDFIGGFTKAVQNAPLFGK